MAAPIPAPPKRCQYDPKGWLMGTPYHSFSFRLAQSNGYTNCYRVYLKHLPLALNRYPPSALHRHHLSQSLNRSQPITTHQRPMKILRTCRLFARSLFCTDLFGADTNMKHKLMVVIICVYHGSICNGPQNLYHHVSPRSHLLQHLISNPAQLQSRDNGGV